MGLRPGHALSTADVAFRAFRRFNRERPALGFASRSRPGEWIADWFGGDGIEDRLARALLDARAVPFKEILESFEFFERSRGHVRAPVVADLCSGHGLAGMLYGVFHRDVDRVLLVDRVRPPSVSVCLEALATVAPWLPAKVDVQERAIEDLELPDNSAVLGVHACGGATDAILDVALRAQASVAVLPCCHAKALLPGPATLGNALGLAAATDVHRTYRLHSAGYRTRWTAIPEAITPMNRVILGWPESPTADS